MTSTRRLEITTEYSCLCQSEHSISYSDWTSQISVARRTENERQAAPASHDLRENAQQAVRRQALPTGRCPGDRMEALSGDASTVSGRSDSRRYGDLASDVVP